MEVSVWDTYLKREDNKVMHFDILVPSNLEDETKIFSFGHLYLRNKPFKTNNLSAQICKFCHIERATLKMIEDINLKGFLIIEIKNCN